jgi:hypothetical protein
MPIEPTVVTTAVIDGLEVTLTEALSTVNDDTVSRIFKMIETMDESEEAKFILSTSTAAYR